MKLTLITNSNGLLTKRISYEDGKLHKETFANIQAGTAKRIEHDTFAGLRATFENLRTDQAVVHCPHNHDEDFVKLTTKSKVANGSIARSNEFFQFGPFAVPISFDYDLKAPRTREQWLAEAKRVSPIFEGAGYVFMPSASGGIYNDGELVGESTGMRIICGVMDASDLQRFSKAFADRCWLNGLGEIVIGAGGKMYERTIFDLAMHQPTRIDFLAGAELVEGLEQRRDIYHEEGKLLDTRALLDLTKDEQLRVAHLKSEAKTKRQPEADRIREQWEHNRMEMLRERGFSVTDAATMIKAQLAGVLKMSDAINFDKFGVVRVLDCLKDPEKYANQSCADPLEPERGGSRAAFRYNEETQVATVWSYLHGGQLYKTEFDFKTLCEFYEQLPDEDDRVFEIDKLIRHARLEPVDLERFLRKVKERTKLNIDTLRAQANRAWFSDYGMTHQQMAERYIRKTGEVIFTDGQLWTPDNANIWLPYDKERVETEVGIDFEDQTRCKTGSMYKQVRLQIQNNVSDKTFFKNAPKGFACPSGFYMFNDDDELVREDLTLAHRARFVLPFDPDPEPPTSFLDFLAECFDGAEPETQILRVQELIGAILLGIGVDFEKAFFVFGPENSGKSTTLRIIERLVPEEFACSVPAGLFHIPYYKAMLAGKLLCTMGEGSDLTLGDDFKSMTGRDKQTARPIYEPPFDFYPSATIIVNANEPPVMSKISGAILRRLETLTFPNSRVQAGKSKDNIIDLDQRILAEDQGRLIHWGLEGGRRLKEQNGYTTCNANLATLEEWKLQNDNAKQFLDDIEQVEVTGLERDWIRRAGLYRMYKTWSEEEGLKPMTKAKVTARLIELGYPVSTLDGFEIVRKIVPAAMGNAISSRDDKQKQRGSENEPGY